MADITNPLAVKFANEKVRVTADVIDQLYETLKRYQTEYAAVNGDTIYPATSDNIADGSDVDGRKRCTGNQCRAIKSLADAFVTFMEAGGPPSRIAQVKAISVNGHPRF